MKKDAVVTDCGCRVQHAGRDGWSSESYLRREKPHQHPAWTRPHREGDYLIQYEEDTDQELEFDPIAYCCEYTEFNSFEDVKKNYDVEDLEHLEQNTIVLKIPNSEKLVIQNY